MAPPLVYDGITNNGGGTMYTIEDIKANEDGDLVIEIESANLPNVTIDTYTMFTTDHTEENEIEHYNEMNETDLGYDDFDWDYDHAGILKGLAELSVESILGQIDTDIIKSIEVLETYSPQFYNFATDSYNARYTVDLTKLEEWADSVGFDLDTYVAEHHQSYDGFISFIPSAVETDRVAMGIYLMIAAYIRATVEADAHNMHIWGGEYEVYAQNITFTAK